MKKKKIPAFLLPVCLVFGIATFPLEVFARDKPEDIIAHALRQQVLERNPDGQTGIMEDPHGNFVVYVTPVWTQSGEIPCRSYVQTIKREGKRPVESGGVMCRENEIWVERNTRGEARSGYGRDDDQQYDGKKRCVEKTKKKKGGSFDFRKLSRVMDRNGGIDLGRALEALGPMILQDDNSGDATCTRKYIEKDT